MARSPLSAPLGETDIGGHYPPRHFGYDQRTPGHTARDAAIDTAMRELYGTHGPDEDVNANAVRAILGRVYDQGQQS